MTYIARGITVKGITVKAPLVRGIQVAGGFTPEFLFLDGQQGVWHEPKPVIDGQQVLYQDAAATTPVTSDGDPVGYMRDLSGNGNHATQSTSAARPLYRTDGTLHWLSFDGVDDFLSLPIPEYAALSASLAFNTPNLSNNYLFDSSSGKRRGLRGDGTDGIAIVGDGGDQVSVGGVLVDGQAHVLSYRSATNDARAWVDSTLVLSSTSLAFSGTSTGVNLGTWQGASSVFFQGDYYGSTFRGGLFSSSEREALEKYLAKLAGIQL